MTCFLFTTNLSPLALACHPFSNILAPLIVQAFLEVKLTDQLKQTVTLFPPWIWPKGSEVIIIPIHKQFGITLFWKTSHSCCTQIIQIYWEVANLIFFQGRGGLIILSKKRHLICWEFLRLSLGIRKLNVSQTISFCYDAFLPFHCIRQ